MTQSRHWVVTHSPNSFFLPLLQEHLPEAERKYFPETDECPTGLCMELLADHYINRATGKPWFHEIRDGHLPPKVRTAFGFGFPLHISTDQAGDAQQTSIKGIARVLRCRPVQQIQCRLHQNGSCMSRSRCHEEQRSECDSPDLYPCGVA